MFSAIDNRISLDTSSNVKQTFFISKSEKPIASVILFRGSNGKINNIDTDGNSLVRMRSLFTKQGFLVAVVDASFDKQS